jgi:30S ribosomal protein S31
MGKGDKKTAKGKRVMGSYGNTRKRKSDEKVIIPAAKVKKEKKEPTVKKAAPAVKKVAVKKPKAE